MDLRNTQIKDTYGNLVTLGTTSGAPTTGFLQNGQGSNVTALTMTSTTLEGGLVVNELGASVDFRVEGDTDANLLFVDASADAVGIGTNAPAALLTLQDGNVNDVSGSKLRMNLGPNPYWEIQARNGGTSATRQLGFYTSATSGDVLTLAQNGNVGIGTTSPTNLLTVGTDSSTGGVTLNGTTGGAIIIRKAGTLTGFVGDTAAALGSGDGMILYTYSGATRPILFYTEGTEKMRIDSSGNVGIGVTPKTWSTSYKALQVNTNSVLSATSSTLFLGNNWYVDTSPDNKYIGSGSASLYGQTGGVHTFFTAGSGSADASITFTERFKVGETETVVNDPQGDHDFRVESDTNSHALFVDAGNNAVGILNSNPRSPLEIKNGNRYAHSIGVIKTRDLSNITVDLLTLSSYAANSVAGIYVRIMASMAVGDHAAIIEGWASARNNAGSYTYSTTAPVIEKNILGSGVILAGSLAWNGDTLQYTTSSGNYTGFSFEIIVNCNGNITTTFFP